MTFLAIDGRFAGKELAHLPKGYHCVLCCDGHPDIISDNPDYGRPQFIDGMMTGLEEMLHGEVEAVMTITNRVRHGAMSFIAIEVLSCMIDVNLAIWHAQLAARGVKGSKKC